MNNPLKIIYIAALCLFFFLRSASALELKISAITPDGSVWMQQFRKAADEISEKTSNRVRFKFYPGGIMGDGNTVLRKIRFGQLHGATLTNASLSDVYPDIQLYNLILKFHSLDEVDYVRSRMDDQLLKGIEQTGLVPMGFSEIGFAYLMSTIPITKIDDMRNQKAWSPDTNYVAQIALEAFPVARIPLAIGDVLMGLQTGMVDIVPGSPVAALALQWHTKLKFITELPLSYVYGVMVIDNRAFKKISQSDQQIVRDVMGKAMDEIGKLNRKDNSGAMNALKNQGVEFIKPNREEAAEIRRIMEGANEKFIRSGKISERMVEQFDQYLKDSRSR